MSRRLKRVCFSVDMELSKYALIAVLRKLPEDAKIIRCDYAPHQGCSFLVVHSEDWDVVPEGMTIPEYAPWVSMGEEVDARTPNGKELHRSFVAKTEGDPKINLPPGFKINMDALTPGACTCDRAYTGERYHKQGCPLRQ